MDKNQLRKYMQIIWKTINTKDYSEKIIKNIKLFPQYQNAKNVMIYYPMKNELDLRPLLEDDKNFYLPKIIDNEIYACPYKQNDELVLSEYKTQEPLTEPISRNMLDVVIVPGICADFGKNRIGHGQGFYDRFLSTSRAFSIFALPECCIINNIPTEDYDQKVHFLITEDRVIF